MTSPAPDENQIRRITEAAAWRVRLHELDRQSIPEFDDWLASNPANAAAWRQVEGPWELFGDHATSPPAVAARRDALARAYRESRPMLPRWTSIAATFAIFGLAAVLYLATSWWSHRPDIYATAHGERRIVQLADGSRLSLDSETEIKVAMENQARDLELIKGQARFDVAHDAARPFSVKVGPQTVIATGTAFNIDMVGRQTLITLIQGRIEVRGAPPIAAASGSPRRAPLALAAGQQLIVNGSAPVALRRPDLEKVTAWEAGQLVFDDEPLSSVVSRVSRYSDRPITVSPGAADLRVSGVFQSNDVPGFVETVSAYLPVRPKQRDDGGIELVHRG